MSLPSYLSITGERQGLMSQGASTKESVGNYWQEGFEDQILVTSFDHQMDVPLEHPMTSSSGQRCHQPFILTKRLDKSSPLLATALNTGEAITDCCLTIFRYGENAGLEKLYTVKLQNARIVKVHYQMPHIDLAKSVYPIETIGFSYQRIDWQHEGASTTGMDSWNDQL